MPVMMMAQVSDISKPGDVLINEVMANPNGLTTLPQTEYVEIHNASGGDITLNGWKFVYAGNETDLPNVVLPAGAYAVLYRTPRDIYIASGGVSLGHDKFPSALLNTGNTIGLKNANGETMDEITYPNSNTHAGKSTERGDDNTRSEERRVGKESTRLCRSRWSPYH
jgi:hypothetical protein